MYAARSAIVRLTSSEKLSRDFCDMSVRCRWLGLYYPVTFVVTDIK